ncbi:tetratricopeptide repeat protein [Azospirillum picis]|uniref:Tetratricopeptide (TPR) repeat protein n=1 Tax=Azospirillum picis TaxID=488438 RepID=A0ABU0MGW1_9PROT|nr:tetratricopeptide repeat protein [Azospirillum picis]MBP2299083.1 tetratricopeptide (TPR) repeat protein [Azospirillum picis]MDQ0532675.1 tetratricopeptide (TPR) repeat protein [Azospirillum picis]
MSCLSTDVDACLAAAYHHHQTGGFDEAEALYRGLLSRAPDTATGLHRYGLLAAQLGRLEDADRLLSWALAVVPSDPEAAVNHGKILRALRHPGKAARRFCQALALDPTLAAAQEGLGHTGRERGDPAAAATGYGRAVRCGGGSIVLQLWGTALAAAGRTEEAIEILQDVVRRDPMAISAAFLLGQLLIRIGNGAEAAACFRRVIVLRPNHDDARRCLAAVGKPPEPLERRRLRQE